MSAVHDLITELAELGEVRIRRHRQKYVVIVTGTEDWPVGCAQDDSLLGALEATRRNVVAGKNQAKGARR